MCGIRPRIRSGRPGAVAHRLLALFVIPVLALAMSLVGTRRLLARYARHWNVEDLPGRAEDRMREKAPEATGVILDYRDARLVRALAAIHDDRHDEPIAVAVVYGAGHMPAVTRQLFARFGYRPRTAEWLQVIDY